MRSTTQSVVSSLHGVSGSKRVAKKEEWQKTGVMHM